MCIRDSFNTALTGFEQKNGRLTGIFTTGGTFPCEALVFAVGHSARDTFGMLMDSGLAVSYTHLASSAAVMTA